MTTYSAQIERGDKYWLVNVPEIGQTTQARNLGEVESMARDLIAVMLSVPSDSFDVEVKVQMPEVALAHWLRAATLRQESAAKQSEAAAEARAAALELSGMGLTVRDIGKLLDISHQRAGQLILTKPATK